MQQLAGARVFVAGHRGMAGSAIVRRLESENCEIVVADRRSLDLGNQQAVQSYFKNNHVDIIIIAAAKVGGILANSTYPAEFLYSNLMIVANIIDAAHSSGVDRLLFLGSSCIYPKMATQPISEDSLLTGPLEPTNEWYAIAKIAGIKMASAYRRQYGRDYISAMPTNLYGPGDNFDLDTSHVLPALIRKAHEAKVGGADSIEIWGTGLAKREFLHVDDCASACVFLLKNYHDDQHINVGFGSDISILDLTKLVCEIVGFKGEITHDHSKPDGTPRKLLSNQKLTSIGWVPRMKLEDGIRETYQWLVNEPSISSKM